MSSLYTGEKPRVGNLRVLLGLAALGFAAAAVSSEAGSVEDAGNSLVAERLAALDQARALYLPTLDLNARYTRANGGRTIGIPVGDLLNPVYASLNQITGNSRF